MRLPAARFVRYWRVRIDDLPPAFRTVLVMRDVEEATVEETAKILGIKAEMLDDGARLHLEVDLPPEADATAEPVEAVPG